MPDPDQQSSSMQQPDSSTIWRQCARAFAGSVSGINGQSRYITISEKIFDGLQELESAGQVGRGIYDLLALGSRPDPMAIETYCPKGHSALSMYQAVIAALTSMAKPENIPDLWPGAALNITAAHKAIDEAAKQITDETAVCLLSAFDTETYALTLGLLSEIFPDIYGAVQHMPHLLGTTYQTHAAAKSVPHSIFAGRLAGLKNYPVPLVDAWKSERWDELVKLFAGYILDMPGENEKKKYVDEKMQDHDQVTPSENEKKLDSVEKQLDKLNALQPRGRRKRRQIKNQAMRLHKQRYSLVTKIGKDKANILRCRRYRILQLESELDRLWIEHAEISIPQYNRKSEFIEGHKKITATQARESFGALYRRCAGIPGRFTKEAKSLRNISGTPKNVSYPTHATDGLINPATLASYLANPLGDLPALEYEEIRRYDTLDIAVQFMIACVRPIDVAVDARLRERRDVTVLAVDILCAQLARLGVASEILAYTAGTDLNTGEISSKTKYVYVCKPMSPLYKLKDQRGLAVLLDKAMDTIQPSYVSPTHWALERPKSYQAHRKISFTITTFDYRIVQNLAPEEAYLDTRVIEKLFLQDFEAYKLEFGGPDKSKSCKHVTAAADLAASLCALITQKTKPERTRNPGVLAPALEPPGCS